MKRLLLSLILMLPLSASAVEPLVADLSKHLVAITTGFAGTDVLLFGAIEEVAGGEGDVVVVVRGPTQTETVRRKARQAGIWANTGSAEITGAPAFYWVATTRPLAEIAPPGLLERHQIGTDHLALTIEADDAETAPPDYRRAFLRLKKARGLYGVGEEEIAFLGRRLFRTDMHFPANVPVGTYLVEVYLIARGEVVSAQTTPLVVSKAGIGADVYDFAHQQSALYGIIAILMAVAGGWMAAVVFRK